MTAVRRFVLAALAGLFLLANVHSFCLIPSCKRIPDRNSICLRQQQDDNHVGAKSPRRRMLGGMMVAATSSLILLPSSSSQAAPPIAIIAEELGYFPVTNREGNTVYISKRVSRTSSNQAIALAKHLRDAGVTMYGAFWCPHCARQKELFGKEAWSLISYVECAPQGYNANPKLCKAVNGFPEWKLSTQRSISGEVPLSILAEASGFAGFDESKEETIPPLVGGKACK